MKKKFDAKGDPMKSTKEIPEQPEISVSIPLSLWSWILAFIDETVNDREKEVKHWTQVIHDPHIICNQTAKDTLEFWKTLNEKLGICASASEEVSHLIEAHGNFTINACDNTDYSLTFRDGTISVSDKHGHVVAEFDADDAPVSHELKLVATES